MAYLVAEAGLSPQKILSMTFTNKAAREMVQRAETLLGDVVERSGTIPRHWIGTFHANCARMLRTHARLLHYTPNFTITDMDDRLKIIKELIALHGYRHLDKTGRVKEEISHAKNNFLDAEDLARMAAAKGDPAYLELSELYRAYNSYLLKNNTMDFDDLIVNMVKLLYLDEEVRSFWQQRFDYIMVDEFQDTNKSQYLLLKMLMRPGGVNLTMVGDDDQSIYAFRGANVENILRFERDFPSARMIVLGINYRSTPAIIEAAYHLIGHNKERHTKDVKAHNPEGELITYFDSLDAREEAELIAAEIFENRISRQVPYHDQAVLCRTNTQMRTFEEVFREKSIPYKLIGGYSFFDRKEIKDVLSYLKLIHNPSDNLSFLRTINFPKRGIGPKTMEDVMKAAVAHNLSFFDAV
ncbi:MAG: ATP-dependent DNA helicase PcrA, partial [Spirochaetae bacterium HGW-Spirochaetae-6]